MNPRAKKAPASSRDRKKSTRPPKITNCDSTAHATEAARTTPENADLSALAAQNAVTEQAVVVIKDESVNETTDGFATPEAAAPDPEPSRAPEAVAAPETELAASAAEAAPDSCSEPEAAPDATAPESSDTPCGHGISVSRDETDDAGETPDNAPVVSVIMNCRNSAAYLREAINCVFNQTFSSWEIIFWDNGSTDGSPKIAQSFTDKRMRYFRADEPTPLGEARNLAIAKARGRYIAFLDCDDLWAPTKLEKQVALLEKNPDIGLVCTDTMIFSGRSFTPGSRGTIRRMFAVAAPHRGMVFRQLMTSGWIAMSSAVIRRSALDGLEEWFDPTFNVAEEADLFYRIAHDWEFDYIHEILTGWRVHSGNNTFARIGEFADETRRILQKHERLYPHYAEEYPDIVALLSRRAAFQSAVALWRDGNGSLARREIAGYPQTPKLRAFWFISWLPGSLFNAAARAYQFLPTVFRR